MSEDTEIGVSAEAVARGLIATGTAKAVQRYSGNYLKLFCGNGGEGARSVFDQ
jgi:hypothetical protein